MYGVLDTIPSNPEKPVLWAVDRRRYINKQGNWAFRPLCSRNDDPVDDASVRVHFTCGIVFGLLGDKAVDVGSMIARLHDHKGTLYVVQRRDASPFNETVKAAFQEAWADDAPEFVDIDSPDWQRVWSCRCFN
jgi:hypothetical protein